MNQLNSLILAQDKFNYIFQKTPIYQNSEIENCDVRIFYWSFYILSISYYKIALLPVGMYFKQLAENFLCHEILLFSKGGFRGARTSRLPDISPLGGQLSYRTTRHSNYFAIVMLIMWPMLKKGLQIV